MCLQITKQGGSLIVMQPTGVAREKHIKGPQSSQEEVLTCRE